MAAYYNEFDPQAAAWLRELINEDHIAPGDVDERSIADVTAEDLRGYTQCHFFAGIGVWSYALRQAGWSDDQPVWTGSCPCQPFSSAGRRGGVNDDRHLWPYWFWLIAECQPSIVFGEQVASPDGLQWLDIVSSDLEGANYAVGAADLCAAGVGAPHIRQRSYFVADANNTGPQRRGRAIMSERADQCATGEGGASGGLANTRYGTRRASHTGANRAPQTGWAENNGEAVCYRKLGGLADDTNLGRNRRRAGGTSDGGDTPWVESERLCNVSGFWFNADWLPCRDGKWRPVEPGTFPLAHGAPARVGRLRGYGNAIVAPLATTFIQAYQDVVGYDTL